MLLSCQIILFETYRTLNKNISHNRDSNIDFSCCESLGFCDKLNNHVGKNSVFFKEKKNLILPT